MALLACKPIPTSKIVVVRQTYLAAQEKVKQSHHRRPTSSFNLAMSKEAELWCKVADCGNSAFTSVRRVPLCLLHTVRLSSQLKILGTTTLRFQGDVLSLASRD